MAAALHDVLAVLFPIRSIVKIVIIILLIAFIPVVNLYYFW